MNRLRKNDTVCVISGKDKGSIGQVLEIDHKNDRVLVKGVNIITRHVKPRAMGEKGKLVKEERAIHISNVMVVDPKTNKPTRVGVSVAENGKRVRVSRSSGEVL